MNPLADVGDARARAYLGELYLYGRGVRQDRKKAAWLFRQAADQGVADAQYALAVMYFNGLGVTKDTVEAEKWYRLAASNGSVYAQVWVEANYAAELDKGGEAPAATWAWRSLDTSP